MKVHPPANSKRGSYTGLIHHRQFIHHPSSNHPSPPSSLTAPAAAVLSGLHFAAVRHRSRAPNLADSHPPLVIPRHCALAVWHSELAIYHIPAAFLLIFCDMPHVFVILTYYTMKFRCQQLYNTLKT